jgi:hypothetical protein
MRRLVDRFPKALRRSTVNLVGRLGAVWGIGGLCLLLGEAIYRLAPIAVETFDSPLGPLHWAALVVWVTAMLVLEGYRGFQKSFSPRVAARARYLTEHPNMVCSLFAPFFCMGYFHATRGVRIRSILLTTGIVTMVLGVRRVDQPWRGIVGLGVVAGLTWGIISIAVFTYLAFATDGFDRSPETPTRP